MTDASVGSLLSTSGNMISVLSARSSESLAVGQGAHNLPRNFVKKLSNGAAQRRRITK